MLTDIDKDGIDAEKKLLETFSGAIVTHTPNVKWADVAGLEAVKEVLKELVVLPMKFPQLFTGCRYPNHGILLYGAPGSGKTFLVKAVATEAGCSMYSISASDLVSRYLANSERLVRHLFDVARQNKPSIVFLDDLEMLSDSQCPAEAVRRVRTEVMVEMQGVSHSNDGVRVLAATSMPHALDRSIRRRFEKRIYLPLPDQDARARIFEMHIGTVPNNLHNDDFVVLGANSEGYSASDIITVARDACMEPLRCVHNATHFKQVRDVVPHTTKQLVDDMITPCLPTDPAAIETSWTCVPEEKILVPVVTMSDIMRCLQKSKPTVTEEDLRKLKEFLDNFG